MDIEGVFDRWSDGQNVDSNLDSYNRSKAVDFFVTRAEKIYDVAESDADQAFVDLLQLVSFISTILCKEPSMLGRLAELVEKLKRALEKIAEMKFSDSYSISAGLPFGLSVGLSWNTPTTKETGV
jgi:hypothetical protein